MNVTLPHDKISEISKSKPVEDTCSDIAQMMEFISEREKHQR